MTLNSLQHPILTQLTVLEDFTRYFKIKVIHILPSLSQSPHLMSLFMSVSLNECNFVLLLLQFLLRRTAREILLKCHRAYTFIW